MRQGTVYFIRAVERVGLIKIGFSQDVRARLGGFQKGSPVELEIAASLPGDQWLERSYHAMFAADHVRNEWFRPSVRLEALIDDIAAGRPVRPERTQSYHVCFRRPRSARSKQAFSLEGQVRALRRSGVAVPQSIEEMGRRLRDGCGIVEIQPAINFLAAHGRQIRGLTGDALDFAPEAGNVR